MIKGLATLNIGLSLGAFLYLLTPGATVDPMFQLGLMASMSIGFFIGWRWREKE